MKTILTSLLFIYGTILFGQKIIGNQINYFFENKGQIMDQSGNLNEGILYIHSNKSGINTQLKENGFSYDLYNRIKENNTSKFIIDRIDVEFINPSNVVEIIPSEETDKSFNYHFTSSDRKSVNNIRTFHSIVYKNLYPNIDLIFKSEPNGDNIKYDFVLHPGANINHIQLRYKGCGQVELNDGNLILTAGDKLMRESIPMSWYTESGESINIKFKILEESDSFATVGFESDEKITTDQTLIIDPVPELVWSRYIGDSLLTSTNSTITDRFGYIYICGSTQSINNIATSGAYQNSISDSISDAYISKYNTYGSLLWSSYFGGNQEDVANDIYVDTSFNVYLAGTTYSSSGITDSNSYQQSSGGLSDAFLVKFNQLGQFQWATYIGGDSIDSGLKLSTDFMQNIYLGGNTKSPTGIATDSSFQININGLSDGFLSKFDSSGTLIWSTYFGGSDDDYLSGLAFGDTAIHIAGQSFSPDLIVNGTFAQDSLRGLNDGFMARFDPNGDLIWSTYYGGEGNDKVNSIKVFNNNLYFAGTTDSDTNISIIGAFQPFKGGLSDAFIGKMNNAGEIQWATYFGGDSLDQGIDLFFELDSNLFVLGSTNSPNLPVSTVSAYQAEIGGSTDAFLSKFTKDGENLWSTYYGGPDNESPEAIAVYGNTGIFIVGSTNSDTLIVPESQQWATNTFNSNQEGFFTKFRQGKSTCAGGVCSGGNDIPSEIITFCPGTVQMLTIQGGDLGTDADWVWYEGDCGNGPTVGSGDTIFVSPSVTTTYFVRAESITNTTECVYITLFVVETTPISIICDTSVCLNENFTLSATGTGTYNWTGPNNFTCSVSDTTFIINDNNYQGWYYLEYADSNACFQYDSTYLILYISPVYSTEIEQISCFNYNNGSISILSTEDFEATWNVSVTDPMNLTDLSPGEYILEVNNTFNCSFIDTFAIIQPNSVLTDTIVQASDCLDSSGFIILDLDTLFEPYLIYWSPGGLTNDTITNLPYGNYTVTIELQNSCIETHTFLIPNSNQLQVEITEYGNVSCEGLNDGFANSVAVNGNPDYTFIWSPGGQTTSSVVNLVNGTYIVTVTDADGCFAYDTVTISTNSQLEMNSVITSSNCSLQNGAIELTINNSELISSVIWSDGTQDALFVSDLTAGNYFVLINDVFGCSYQYEFNIPAINDLDVVINPGDTVIDFGEALNLTGIVNYSGNLVYSWTPESFLSCSSCQTTSAYPTSDQTYQLIVSEENGCIDTAFITIYVQSPCVDVFIPNHFSPNSDELNDLWEIIGSCIQSMNTKVYDQWGEIIFESSDQSVSWDGYYRGSKVINDQYAFVVNIEYLDGTFESFTGVVRVMY